MNEKLLIKLFDESFEQFLAKDIDNILDDVAEQNLCCCLAHHIRLKLSENKDADYFADIEYNRKQDGKSKTILDDGKIIYIRCDLIVHSRGKLVKDDNLIAIEMKKSTRKSTEMEKDRKRLQIMTKNSYDEVWNNHDPNHPEHVCGYLLGIYIIVNTKKRNCSIEYYQHGNFIYERKQEF
jgi:hypothetical protein